MATYKVIIAGSRNFQDYELLKSSCELSIIPAQAIEIVSGTAQGADKLGERYAKEKGYALTLFPANWAKHGKSAGYIRNEQMAKYADVLIAFWDGESKGTKHMIDLAQKHGLTINVVMYQNDTASAFVEAGSGRLGSSEA